jgi:hypothetical protein
MTLNAERVEDCALRCVERNPEVLLIHQLDLWNWQRYVHVGLKGDRDFPAIWTFYC